MPLLPPLLLFPSSAITFGSLGYFDNFFGAGKEELDADAADGNSLGLALTYWRFRSKYLEMHLSNCKSLIEATTLMIEDCGGRNGSKTYF